MSKFADFLKDKKIDSRRLVSASHRLERLRREDRALKLSRATAKKEEKKDGATPAAKPRSGRPVTPRALAAALAGGALSGPQKTRLLRAVNHILTQKKQTAVELKTLF
jgi:hypothetical protein